jgi:hypothetical protein
MIKIFLGNLGSGKTLHAVKEIVEDNSGRMTYTNLILKGVNNAVYIKPEDVIKKIESDKGKVKLDLNLEYWQKQKRPLNVVWDEIHLMANSRSSTAKPNMVLSKFLAMGRRIVGRDDKGYGTLIFIAQKERTVDVNIRELADEIYEHISWNKIHCHDCNLNEVQSSNNARVSDDALIRTCARCHSAALSVSLIRVEVKIFTGSSRASCWENYFDNKHKKSMYLCNLHKYYKYYDTMQIASLWDSFIED